MPLFDFKCAKCGFRAKDVLLADNDDPPECPKCRVAMNKEWNKGPDIRFIGEGFYATEYGSQTRNFLGKPDENSWEENIVTESELED